MRSELLRWVPGHSFVESNIRADAAARYVAANLDIGAGADEGLRSIEIEREIAEAIGKNTVSNRKRMPK
jgi:hypothetical protein